MDDYRGRYILEGHTPVEALELFPWAFWLEKADLRVAETFVLLAPDVDSSLMRVSTVFLGLDHNLFGRIMHPERPHIPILFETMVFDRNQNVVGSRWTQVFEALAGEGPFRIPAHDLSPYGSVFGGAWRYATWDDAEKGHVDVVKKLERLKGLIAARIKRVGKDSVTEVEEMLKMMVTNGD